MFLLVFIGQTKFRHRGHDRDVGTVSAMKARSSRLPRSQTEMQTCSQNALHEKFVKALLALTALVDGRVQVKMPW